jgi:hypothetical protein
MDVHLHILDTFIVYHGNKASQDGPIVGGRGIGCENRWAVLPLKWVLFVCWESEIKRHGKFISLFHWAAPVTQWKVRERKAQYTRVCLCLLLSSRTFSVCMGILYYESRNCVFWVEKVHKRMQEGTMLYEKCVMRWENEFYLKSHFCVHKQHSCRNMRELYFKVHLQLCAYFPYASCKKRSSAVCTDEYWVSTEWLFLYCINLSEKCCS